MFDQTSRKRPFGVTVIVVLQILTLIALLIDVYLGNQLIPIVFLPGVRQAISLPTTGLAISIYQLVLAWGLWQLKRWAWILFMVQLGLSMSFALWSYFFGVPLYGYMLVNVIIVFYLNQREVQRAFEQDTNGGETG